MQFAGDGLINGGIFPGSPVPVFASANQGGSAQVPVMTGSTSPSVSTNQQTAIPTPTNVQSDPASSTVVTTASGLVSKVKAIVANPSQHIIGAIVLLLVGWFVWKHWK